MESCQAIGVTGGGGGQHLDGHPPLELRVVGEKHLAHPAGTEPAEDFVRAET
jgi:hypothetical protein